ncbi:MAG: NAD(P)H-hydrate dehydratase [bacterium]|jgi:NAD(P)H-hydrate epimerase|nr:NAD(P)H-hydrate dehydratase [candidate division KSB1 bacterium]MDH7558896.1 NAD(P)H-hydrate dehydratase [bacterium]
MRPVLTARQMAECDRRAIQEYGIPGVVLMENAGRGVAELAGELLGNVAEKQVAIFCGKGNNGGDGYVVARHLANRGARVRLFLVGKRSEVRGDAATNLCIVEKMGLDLQEIATSEHIPDLRSTDLVVDALLGTGLQGRVLGLLAEVIEVLSGSHAPILAIDVPSGLDADSGSTLGVASRATATGTMGALKRGLLFAPGREHAGTVKVIDIGMPKDLFTDELVNTWQVEAEDVRQMLPRRAPNAYKNQCGVALVVAGSTGMTGAAVLSAETVLRAGAGLAYLAIPESLNAIIEEKATEVISKPMAEVTPGHLGRAAVEQIEALLRQVDAVAIGPGLGTEGETVEAVWAMVASCPRPLVVDADGLNALAKKPELLLRKTGRVVLTPHPGELARLTGQARDAIVANPVDTAREWAGRWGEVLVLKGAPTVVATPEGKVFINSTGNAGMATGGSGDVLTGLITGLLAQGLSPEQAAVAGVYLHGLAGDLARDELGERGMLAGDIMRQVPAALRRTEDART